MDSNTLNTYTVKYNITVDPSGATEALKGFQSSIETFNKSMNDVNAKVRSQLHALGRSVTLLNKQLERIKPPKPINLTVNATEATEQLNLFAAAAERAANAASSLNAAKIIPVTGGKLSNNSATGNLSTKDKNIAPKVAQSVVKAVASGQSQVTKLLAKSFVGSIAKHGNGSSLPINFNDKVIANISSSAKPSTNSLLANSLSSKNLNRDWISSPKTLDKITASQNSITPFVHNWDKLMATGISPRLPKGVGLARMNYLAPLFGESTDDRLAYNTARNFFMKRGMYVTQQQYKNAFAKFYSGIPYNNIVPPQTPSVAWRTYDKTSLPQLTKFDKLISNWQLTMGTIASQINKVKQMKGVFNWSKTSGTPFFARLQAGQRYLNNMSPITMPGMGGGVAAGLLKGMGIMYGLQGIGTLIHNVIKDSAEYDNITQSTKNILETHDKAGGFDARFSNMENVIRKVGIETKFTAPEVASAAKFLAMAGLNINQIKDAINPIANIALVGDTELGQTADVVTNIMTSYGFSSSQMPRVSDVMTMTFTKTNTTLMEMAEAYKYAGALMSTGNIGFEEATAAIGILGDAGIKGSAAGTALRMILNNIINPTKKQLGEWKRIGVKRTEDGKLRNITDIFKDIQAAGITADSFSRLFRITAVPAAASLARHSNKWEEVTKLNFQSVGLSEDLADKKKNTIQGLWAQITSAVTEAGIQAFEGEQSSLKNEMNRIITKLKEKDTISKFKEGADTVMNFFNKIINVSKRFISIYEAFAPFIKLYVSFQLAIWPLTKAFSMFKSTLMGLKAITGITARIGGFSAAIQNLGNTSASLVGKLSSRISNPNYANSRVGTGYLNLISGKNYTQEHWQKIAQTHPNTFTKLGSPIASNVLSAFGGVGGYFAGSEIGKAVGGNSGSVWGSIIGTMALPALLVGGPITAAIGLIVAGIGGIAAAWYNASEKAGKAKEKADEYVNALKIQNGLATGEGASKYERYWAEAHGLQKSLTDTVQKRVDLLKEEQNLLGGGGVKDGAKYIDASFMESVWDNMNDANSMFTGHALYAIANKYSNNKTGKLVHSTSSSENAAGAYLYAGGFNAGAKIIERIQGSYRELLSLPVDKLDSALKQLNEDIKKYTQGPKPGTFREKTAPSTFDFSLKEVKDWSDRQKAQSFQFQLGIADRLNPIFGDDSKAYIYSWNYFNKLKSKTLKERDVVNFVGLADPEILSLYNDLSSKGLGQLGFWNGGFKRTKYNLFNKNGQIVGSRVVEAADAAQLALEKLMPFKEYMSQLPTASKQAANGIINLVNALIAAANATIWNSKNPNTDYSGLGPVKDGAEDTIEGQTYKLSRKSNEWTLIDKNTKKPIQAFGKNVVLSNAAFQAQKRALQDKNYQDLIGNHNIENARIGAPTASKDAYKSNYNNNSAAPKQVVVNIENLMNVDKIDLSKKDNKETVDNLKSELAQCLVDVVKDFEEWIV